MNKNVPIPYCPFYRPFNYQNSAHGIKRFTHVDKQISGVGENVLGFFAGRGFTPSGERWRRKRMRTPTSLAFVDSRTDQQVIVTSDGSYGDPFLIAALLKQYAASVQHIA